MKLNSFCSLERAMLELRCIVRGFSYQARYLPSKTGVQGGRLLKRDGTAPVSNLASGADDVGAV